MTWSIDVEFINSLDEPEIELCSEKVKEDFVAGCGCGGTCLSSTT